MKKGIQFDSLSLDPFCSFRELLLDKFLYLGALAYSVSEVVQLCAANLTTADYVNSCYVGRVKRECLFYAYAICYTANCECFGDTAAMTTDNGAFEHLDSFAGAFLDLVVNANCVTYVEGRNCFLELLISKNFEFVHCDSPSEFLIFGTFVRSFAEDCPITYILARTK